MARCPNCKRKGFLVQLTKNGVCEHCKQEIANEITSKFKVIIDTVADMKQSKDLKRILSGSETVLKLANDLSQYDEYNIIETKFAEIVTTAENEKENFIIEYFDIQIQLTRAKVEGAENVKDSSKYYRNLIENAIDNLVNLNFRRAELEELINTAKREQKDFELNYYTKLGEKYELKGETKKALDSYYEALYLEKNIEQCESNRAKKIEGKIIALGGKLK